MPVGVGTRTLVVYTYPIREKQKMVVLIAIRGQNVPIFLKKGPFGGHLGIIFQNLLFLQKIGQCRTLIQASAGPKIRNCKGSHFKANLREQLGTKAITLLISKAPR